MKQKLNHAEPIFILDTFSTDEVMKRQRINCENDSFANVRKGQSRI